MSNNSKSTVKDMTVGNPFKLLIGFSIPLFLGNLFQQFYALVDTLIVGRVLGQDALAAVGCTGSVNFLVVGFCMGLCAGFAIPVSQRFGANDYKQMRRYVANCLWVSIFFAVIITVIVSINSYNILHLMRTPDNIIDMANEYIFIIFVGIPATILYNMLSGLIRALGDSKTPLVFLIISSFLNIFLDIVCMVNLGMGIPGAAIATIVSQGISGLLCLIYIIRKFEILHIKKDEWKYDTGISLSLCEMGIPMGLQFSITALGAVILQSSVNTLGSEVVAASTAANKTSMFFSCGFDAMGTAMATYTGQNVGAKKLDRISRGLRDCMYIGAVYALFSFVVLYFGAVRLTSFFVTDPTPAMIEYSRMILLYNAGTYILLAAVIIIRFAIQGMGFSKFAMIAGVAEMIARMIGGFVLVPLLGVQGAAISNPLAWLFADLFLIPAFFYCKKKLEKMFNNTKGAEYV